VRVSIIIFLIGFLSVIPVVIVGVKMFDGRVEAGSYEKGLAYDETRRIIKEKGYELNIIKSEYSEDRTLVTFTLGGEQSPDTINAEVSRPVGKEVIVATAEKIDDGYLLSLPSIEQGNHTLTVLLEADGKLVAIRKNFYISK
jgi:hypothetical protein